MLHKEIEVALNKQVNEEFYSAYLYLAMSSYCSKIGLNGAAHWFMVQYEEERSHALKIYTYLIDQDADVELAVVEKPTHDFDSLLHVYQETLKHEQYMTNNFNELSDLTLRNKDHATYNFLQWFVNEQVEEESTVKDIISKLKLVGESGNGLFMVDSDLATRPAVNQTTIPQ